MSFLSWLSSRRSVRVVALSHYKRGLAHTKRHDVPGALAEFSAAIDEPNSPIDVKAMALYNRALLFAAAEDQSKAVADLQAVLAATAPLPDIKRAAKRRLERIENRRDVNARAQRQPRFDVNV
jgi:hypothetical protein